MSESQNIEYKESWRDEYLKWICGFANAQGGKIYIGIADNQKVIGVADAKRLMEDIPNKIVSNLGIIAQVNLLEKDGLPYIEIVVEPSTMPVAYHGTYHLRSGSTKQELRGVALQHFILNKMGRSWDDLIHTTATIEHLDRQAIEYFLQSSAEQNRLESISKIADTMTVLRNLHLVSEDGKLKYAALLLFGKDPLQYFPDVRFKIGRFGNDASELMFDDIIEGNILEMPDKVMRVLASKYLISPIRYDGLHRIESLEIPDEALREILCNAIVHKDYQSTTIQMKVFNDRIEVWNPGPLPMDFSIENLFTEHYSHARNRNIANTFYRAGLIEAWGRGIEKICKSLKAASLQPPKIEEKQGGVVVTVMRDLTLQTPQRTATHHPTTTQLPPKYHLSSVQVQTLWSAMNDDTFYNVRELMDLVHISNRRYFSKSYLAPAVANDIIVAQYPDQPHHPRQKYRRK